MPKEHSLPLSKLTKWSLTVSGLALAVFAIGFLAGNSGSHQPGEEWTDVAAFVLCRVLSPALAAFGWTLGLTVVLMQPQKPVGALTGMLLLLLVLFGLFFYSAWLGSAAFHPNSLAP